ncbi:MAG: SwmB domain-containing protein, partial [Methylococcaceae bacterium]
MMIKAAKQSKINVAGNAHVVTDPAINTADTTAPIFAGATVNGNKLLMTYTETLDTVHTAAAKAFTVKVDGVANAVQAVLVNAAAKTVTLTLTTAVSHGAVVRVGYTDPSGNNNINAIQDAAGNDALTLTAAHVTNNTPDTTAPVFASAEVNGGTLVMTYSEALDAAHSPAAGKFAVAVGGVATIVTDVAVNAAAKTVILTLKTPVERNDAVTVSYTDPSLKNNLNAIQDAVGNDALSLVAQTVLNATPADTVAPVFAAAAVNGSTLVLTYGEALDATHIPAAGKFAVAVGGVATIVTDVAINAAAKTVILTLKTPVERNDAVTVSYTDPSVKNNLNAIQDAAGNDALSLVAQTVINTTPADTVAPIFAGAAVNGSTLVMTYGEVLDAAHMPAAGKFAVAVGGIANIVTDVAVNAAAKTVILTLKTPVDSTDVVTVGYTDPSGSNNVNAIQDAAGNDALSIVAQTVINTTPADTVAPIFASAAVNGS